MDVPCFGRQLKWLCCAFDIQELPEVIGEVHEGHEGQQSFEIRFVRSRVSQVTFSGSTILHQTAWLGVQQMF